MHREPTRDEWPDSNVEMSARIHQLQAAQREEIRKHGCCKKRDGNWCKYLNAICPDMALAVKILHETRGLR